MSWASSEVVGVLAFLLPGFVAAAVFYSLTSHPMPSPFERVVQALVFTVIVQPSVWPVRKLAELFGLAIRDAIGEIALAVCVAALVGMLFAVLFNHDCVHRLFRWLRITRENSHPSEWCSTFSRNRGYVVLHLNDRRRLFGWPEEWPNRSDGGHFCITEAEWLGAEVGSESDGQGVTEVAGVLIPAVDVKMVEFTRTPY